MGTGVGTLGRVNDNQVLEGCEPRPLGPLTEMEAGSHNGRATSSNFSTVGKAGVSITSEESRFSKTAAGERSSDPEWETGLK